MAEKTLSKDEVASLLKGIADTLTGKDDKNYFRNVHDTQIVLVLYGEKHHTTHASVHLFNNNAWSTAKEYCDRINGLLLAGDEWISAKIINENSIEKINETFVLEDIVCLDDRAVQRILTRINKETLTTAFKDINEEVSQKIKKNMSKRALKMLEEDMQYQGPVRIIDVIRAQKEIVDTIKYLEDTGKIVIARGCD